MFQLRKRDGKLEEFDIKKIESAIEKAFLASEKAYTHEIIELIALKSTAYFN